MNIKEAICLCRSTLRQNRRFIALIAMIVLSCQYMQALDTGSRQYEAEGKKKIPIHSQHSILMAYPTMLILQHTTVATSLMHS